MARDAWVLFRWVLKIVVLYPLIVTLPLGGLDDRTDNDMAVPVITVCPTVAVTPVETDFELMAATFEIALPAALPAVDKLSLLPLESGML